MARQARGLIAWVWILVAASAWAQATAAGAAGDGAPRFRVGDEPGWASVELDDAHWERRGLLDAPDAVGVLWARLGVELDAVEVPALLVSAAAAREVFWDGVYVGRAGVVGSTASAERAGPIDAVFPIPRELGGPGEHLVAIRFSTFLRPARTSGLLLDVAAGDLRDLTREPFHEAALPLVFLGGFVLIALYYAVLYAADRRRRAYAYTSALCLAVAALLVAELWRQVFGYDYDLHGLRLDLVEALTWSVGLLLTATFALQFDLPRRRTLLAVLAAAGGVVLFAVGDHESATHALFVLALTTAAGVTGWAVARAEPGARLAFGGVGGCLATLLVTGRDFMDGPFFPAFGVLVAGILVSLGLQTRDERARFAAARAAAARLEAELLKKHLAPHFLMNTLTSVMEWVETDPPRGARALEALAAELRALCEVSGAERIPMARELELCHAHLAVMGFRRAVELELDARGVDPGGAVPPAVIHTLVENAVTHNAYAGGRVVLTLRESRAGGRRRLELRAPLAGAAREARLEGGGLRYVRARLEESAPGAWSLDSGVEGDAWVTRIELPWLEAA